MAAAAPARAAATVHPGSPPRRELARLPSLGVGLAYQVQLRPFLEAHLGELGYVEIVPDITWHDRGRAQRPRYLPIESELRFLEAVARTHAIVPHSIGLSIGSAQRFERAHVEQLARWRERLPFAWHSDHLSYHLVPGAGGERNLNLALPLCGDERELERVARRVRAVRARIDAPFLLENHVDYFPLAAPERGEPEFLNELCRRSGCGLLLDLHNLYTNARNHGFDARAWLARLDLAQVVELHVAGGLDWAGCYLDAHSGPPPREVLRLLEWVLPQCEQARALTFELFGTWYERVGEPRLAAEIARLNEIWARRAPRAGARRSA